MRAFFFMWLHRLMLPALLMFAAGPVAAGASNHPDSAEGWLERFDQRTDEIETVRARVEYDRVKELLGDEQTRRGRLYYRAQGPDEPAQFAVHFKELVVSGSEREQDRWYIFDGRWLAEKRVDAKVFTRRELVPAGEKRDLLEIGGEGPFVLPLNQDKQHVLERFKVELIEPGEDDPKNTVHLRLLPREGQGIDIEQLDVWYGRDSLFPERVVTRPNEQERAIVRLIAAETDVPLKERLFDTRPPQGEAWQVEIKRLEQAR